MEHLLRAGIKAGAFHGFHPRVLAEMLFATIGRLPEPEVMATLGLSASEAFEEAYAIFEKGIISGATRRTRVPVTERDRFGLALRKSWPAPSRAIARASTPAAADDSRPLR